MTYQCLDAPRIIQMYFDGTLREDEAVARLDHLQVRGAFDGLRYIGYDYANQTWVEEAA
jgi:hypothetical protein